jgi:hypothetical protein
METLTICFVFYLIIFYILAEEKVTKYSFRNRDEIRRETMNIQTLGGDGGGCARSNKLYSLRNSERISDRQTQPPIYHHPRMNFSGKIPNPAYYKSKSRRHKGYDKTRKHFDSSSDSGSQSSGDNRFNRHHSNGSVNSSHLQSFGRDLNRSPRKDRFKRYRFNDHNEDSDFARFR